MNKKKTLWTTLTCAALILAVAISWRWIGDPMVRFVQDPQAFRVWVEKSGPLGWLAYVGMCIVQVILAFIPGEPFEIAGGYAFGWLGGSILCILGATLGSAVSFSIVKRFGHRAAHFLASRERIQHLSFLQDEHKLHRIIFLLFFLPGTPKDILTYCAALTPMTTGRFLLIASLARIPSVISSALGGHALGTQKYLYAAIVFGVTLLISLLGLWVYKKITAHRSSRRKTPAL